MYMYNLLFNFDATTGLFSGDDPTTGPGDADLRKSNNWLELVGPGTSITDPEVESWTDLGQASTLLLKSSPRPGEIGIRVAVDRRGSMPSSAAKLELIAAFGRPVPFLQQQASPFTHDGTRTGNVLTTFAFSARTRNTSGDAWYFPFGEIAKRPDHHRLSHRYQFSVGVIVTDGAKVRHYGEDPEMDVGD